ncbi:MAG: choice-of-anchor L domain-containing protein [Bacteroidota bacterium]
MKKILLYSALFLSGALSVFSQINITNTTNYTQVLTGFVLSGVTVSNPVFTGDSAAVGTFTNGSSTNIGMSSGIILSTGRIDTIPAIGDSVQEFLSTFNNTPGDALLGTLVTGAPLYDAAVFEFDVIPNGNMMEFKYVFASEEYPEFAGSSFNDVFGFFITGQNPAGGNYADVNIALLPGSGSPVCINNVNATTNSQYYVDNQTQGGTTIAFDGFTTVLTAQAAVVAGTSYHLKLAVSDVADGIFDSGIFLKAQSLKSYILTDIEENSISAARISSNPINDNTVLYIDMINAGNANIHIFDYTGSTLYSTSQTFDAGTQQFMLGNIMSNKPTGVYFLSVETSAGRSIQKMIVL